MILGNESNWLGLIVTGLLFGFGFAIGQTLWGAIIGLVQRRQQP